MKPSNLRRCALLSAALATLSLTMHAQASSLYWDTNSSAPGAGNPATGTWDTATANWNTDPTGADQGVIAAYPVDGSATDVIFSAGSDAVSGHTVTIKGNVAAHSITSNFGTQTFAGGNFVTGQPPTDTLTLGAGGWMVTKGTIQNGAPNIGASLTLVIGAPRTWTMNAIPSFFTVNAPVQFNSPLTLTRTVTTNNANFSFKNSLGTGSADINLVGTGNAVTILIGANSIYDTNGIMLSGPLGTSTVKINQGRVESAATTSGTGTFTIGNPMEVTGTTAAFGGQAQIGPLIFTGPVTLDAGAGKTITMDGPTTAQFLTFNGPISLLTSGTFSVNTKDSTVFAGPVSDDFAATSVAKTLTKTGAGTLTMSGTNTFHGALTITNGGVVLQSADLHSNVANAPTISIASIGSLDVTGIASGFAVASGQTLTGNGKVLGNVTVGAGAVIAPGSGGLNLQNNLNLPGGGSITFDSGRPVNVSGSLTVADGGTTTVVLPNLNNFGPGTSAIISYNGTLSGTGTFAVSAPPNTRANPSVDATQPGAVNLVINGSAANLVWTGDGAGNQWNVVTTKNWNNAGTSDFFYNLDNVTFDDSSANTTVNVAQTVTPGSVTINGSQSYTFQGAGAISGATGLIVGGATLNLLNSNNYTGGTTVNSGRLIVGNANAVPSGLIAVTGGSLVLAPSLSRAVKAFPLTLTGGLVDINNNKLIADYSVNDPIGTLTTNIQSGYNGGQWNGTSGITSSTAAAVAADTNNPHKTGIGFGEASALGIAPFGGVATDSTMVLMRYTYLGDANLDGTVNALDFNALAANYGAGGKSWINGDINYDGNVDSNDFTMLATNFNLSLGAPGAALGTLVPEPASLCALGLASLGLLLRGRR